MKLPDKFPNCGDLIIEYGATWAEYDCGSEYSTDSLPVKTSLCLAQAELATLRADKERLDWLDKSGAHALAGCASRRSVHMPDNQAFSATILREAIDKAMGSADKKETT